MRTGLQVGFGYPLSGNDLDDLRHYRFLARIGGRDGNTPLENQQGADKLAPQILGSNIRPICLVQDTPLSNAHEEMEGIPAGVDIEYLNEPDIGFPDRPAIPVHTYIEGAMKAIEIAKRRKQRLWIGSVGNYTDHSFDYLSHFPWKDIPGWVGVGAHRYPPHTYSTPLDSHLRYGISRFFMRADRDYEVKRLKNIVGTRPLAVTEMGYRFDILSEHLVAIHMAWERQFFERHGYQFLIAYQIRGSDFGFKNERDEWRQPLTDIWAWGN